MKRWESILLMTRMAIGWKSYQRDNKVDKQGTLRCIFVECLYKAAARAIGQSASTIYRKGLLIYELLFRAYGRLDRVHL